MKATYTLIVLLFLCASRSSAAGVTRFWVANTTANWSSISSWATASGGAPGASVPGTGDNATFDNGGSGNCNIDLPLALNNLTVNTTYAGTITQGAQTITLSNNAIFAGGVFAGGSVNMTISGTFTLSGTAFTSTTAILELDGNSAFTGGSFTHNNGTVKYNGAATQTISGTSPVFNILELVGKGHNFTLSSTPDITVLSSLNLSGTSTYNINTGTIDVNGDINVTNTATGDAGTGTININGTGLQHFNGGATAGQGALPKLTINKTSGALNLANFPTVSNAFTYTAGTVNAGTSTFCFTDGSNNPYIISGSLSLNNLEFLVATNGTFTIPAATTLTAAGNLTLAGTANLTLNTGNINVNGNILLTNTATGGGGSAIINIIGAGNETLDGSAIASGQDPLPLVNINKAGGTLSLAGNISFASNLTYTAGTVDPGTSNSYITNTLTVTGSFPVYNLTLAGTANITMTLTAASTVTVTHTLDIENGANRVNINTGTLAAQGDITVNNTNAGGGGTGTILINGSGAQSLTSTAASGQGRLPVITIQKAAGTLVLAGIISESRNWTYTSGTVDAATNATTVVFGGNNLTIASAGMSFYHVTVTANTSTLGNSLTVAGNLTVNGTGVLSGGANTVNLSGNWSDRATAGFTEGTSTVNFAGTALQTITTAGGENFSNLTVNNTGAGIQLINAVTVATALTMTQGNIDLNGNTATLGISVANNGTLNYTAGRMLNTGSFTRWFKNAAIAGSGGLFPLGTLTDYRPFSISTSANPTAGGTITVAYTDAVTNTAVTIPDDAPNVVQVRKDLNWAVTNSAALTGGTYNLQVAGTGFGTVGTVSDLRLTLVNSVVGTPGTNAGTITNPQVNRTGLSLANLANTFYIGSVNASSSPLPITLVYFSGSVVGSEVYLKWSTASETNNAFFTVQRSKDGVSWESIEQVTGAGTSSLPQYYTARDQSPYAGLSYYRLIQTDLDGKQTYSSIVTIDLKKTAASISLYPNPATDHISIAFAGGVDHEVTLFNANGQTMIRPAMVTANSVLLNVSSMPAGVYFIRIVQDGTTETSKVIIRR
jgi:hypothetical protein